MIFANLIITKICDKIFLTAAQSTGLNTSQSQINNKSNSRQNHENLRPQKFEAIL